MRAYSGDIIQIKATGELAEVDMRTSDMGAIDREYDSAITVSGDIYCDEEYDIYERRSRTHFRKQMNEYLNMSDKELYETLKESENRFAEFMKHVRTFIR